MKSKAVSLNEIENCARCPRLIKHCRDVAAGKVLRRRTYDGQKYWARPVPDFGPKRASVLIVGLAPAAHGANRTGRMFTGDDSGKWLYRALHKSGFAETAGCETATDNRLLDCAITAIAHCAPPDNKPLPEEIENCRPFLLESFVNHRPKVILALGQIAWQSSLSALHDAFGCAIPKPRPAFSHMAELVLERRNGEKIVLFGSYHPSRQNTNTGRLTEPMLDSVFTRVREITERS